MYYLPFYWSITTSKLYVMYITNNYLLNKFYPLNTLFNIELTCKNLFHFILLILIINKYKTKLNTYFNVNLLKFPFIKKYNCFLLLWSYYISSNTYFVPENNNTTSIKRLLLDHRFFINNLCYPETCYVPKEFLKRNRTATILHYSSSLSQVYFFRKSIAKNHLNDSKFRISCYSF